MRHAGQNYPSERSQRGQALVELALSITLLMLLSLGIVEFGRILMITNVVTHAARDGARAAAVEPASNRNSSGMLLSTAAIEARVRDQMRDVMSAADVGALTVAVAQPTTNGIPMVSVTVSGQVPYLFAPLLFGDNLGLSINRAVAFRDEGRVG